MVLNQSESVVKFTYQGGGMPYNIEPLDSNNLMYAYTKTQTKCIVLCKNTAGCHSILYQVSDTVDRDRCYNASLGYQNYLGHINTTYSGKHCQRWDVDTPHVRDLTGMTFVEPDLASVENYCRNPDGDTFFWCYTMDPSQRWEPCNIWECFENNDNCRLYSTSDAPVGSVVPGSSFYRLMP